MELGLGLELGLLGLGSWLKHSRSRPRSSLTPGVAWDKAKVFCLSFWLWLWLCCLLYLAQRLSHGTPRPYRCPCPRSRPAPGRHHCLCSWQVVSEKFLLSTGPIGAGLGAEIKLRPGLEEECLGRHEHIGCGLHLKGWGIAWWKLGASNLTWACSWAWAWARAWA